jgi:hypothetical protein
LDLFRAPKSFKRPEENQLMLEQYLAGLEARYIVLAGKPDAKGNVALEEAGKVIERYRDYRASKSTAAPKPLPEWNEAFLADQLLNQLLPADEARAELVAQLAALKTLDASTHSALSMEWEGVKNDATKADERVSGLLVSALRAAQWKNTQRWIIRTLGTQYAARLRNAFLAALVFGLILIILDARFGPSMSSAALSGLGFAVAAGLLGASFSAMVGQSRVSELDNIEEARAATSGQMIALRLGVGVAAAIIVYFFFESGLVDGALFPDLQQIGFGRVAPIGDNLSALRANAQALGDHTADLVMTIGQANDRIAALIASLPEGSAIAEKVAAVQQTSLGTGHGPSTALATNQLTEKLQVTEAGLTDVSNQIAALQQQWAMGSPPLGRLAPNPDLSKLVVWCFAAGFTQTLVPSMLAKVAPQDSTT